MLVSSFFPVAATRLLIVYLLSVKPIPDISRTIMLHPNTERMRADIVKGIIFRYCMAGIGIVVFSLFHEKLPFPYPHLVSISFAACGYNTIILLFYFFKTGVAEVYSLQLYLDIAFFPVVLYFSGGFISPFIPLYVVMVLFSGVVFSSFKKSSIYIFLFALGTYCAISLGKKFGFLPCYVDFACGLMKNDFLFLLVFSCNVAILFFGHVLITHFQKNLHGMLHESLEDARIVEQQFHQAQKMEAIGELAGGVAHDFNNLLFGIKGYALLLKKKFKNNPQMLHYVKEIITATNRSGDLTKHLLSFARKGKYRSEPVDMHQIVGEVATMLQHTIDKRISITQHLDASPPVTIGDPSQLQNMVLNIALNARDAMPDGGVLVFKTKITRRGTTIMEKIGVEKMFSINPGSYLCLSIVDTGVGIPPEMMANIFEPFYTTKKKGKGTGLGLSAVYGCVKSHHGYIDIDSKQGKGTTFKVYLPSTDSSVQKDKTGTFVLSPRARQAHILVVDDEASVREPLQEYLQELGLAVTAIGDSIEALQYYREYYATVSLVVLDMIMPVMSGHELFRKMKKINPHINALGFTGYSLEDEARGLIDEGILDILQKPLSPDKMARRIDQIIKEIQG
ncbi:MAG: response regulator [Chitinivibrionales bacterium]|nr:response regulator [Chitinivibrionales bacterium]